MLPHLQRAFTAFIFISIIFTAKSQDDKQQFPKRSEIEFEFYQTDVQVTNEDQEVTSFATEYYDESSGSARIRVDVLALGNKLSVFYYNETNEILEVNSTHCKSWGSDESIFAYEPLFYGWLNKEPLTFGPTAPLWYAIDNSAKVKYEQGDFFVRDIKCDEWTLPYKTDRDNVTFHYYFASKDWTTPYNLKGMRVPIRIEVRGTTSRSSAQADQIYPINQITDFAYFRPTISNWRIFQPPQGLGCPLRKSTRDMPKMPKVYRYSAEVVDLLKADENEKSDIEFQQVWYDGVEQLARLDKYTKLRYTSEIYDFNTGVTYSMVDGRTCDIKALRNSFFEGYDGQMIGHLKEPGEVLGLDEKFYYMGKTLIRGIWCDVFESVQTDVTFMKKSLVKLVITVYYSEEYYEVNVDGETETRVPVFYAVKGYETLEKVVINLQYNIFAFDDVIYPSLYSSFRLGRCFPSSKEKSYFIMIFSVTEDIARKMEGQDDYIIEQLLSQITKNAKVSNLRIPFIKADYKSTGVYVTALMLDRPPAIKQFWLENEGDLTTNDPYLKVAPAADTLEKCAFTCVDEGDFICTGFFFCNQACFIKSKDILEPNDDDVPNFNFETKCQEWLRAEKDSTNKEAYLVDALKALENAVLNNTINVVIEIDAHTKQSVPVADVVIGEGPYTGNGNQEKPYDIVINFAKLDPTDETTEQMNYVDTLNDCYMACKKSGDLACSSFSYCPDASNKQCSLSSVLVVDRKRNPDDTVDDKNCFVYSMKYLDFYDPYPGRIALIPGDESFDDVKSKEQCAKHCRTSTKISCRGFEFCQGSSTCVLHSNHVLDLVAGGKVITKKKTTCIHYAAKYAADYLDMGFLLIDDKNDVRQTLTIEECSKICSEELKDKCMSFNYCPASSPYAADSTCSLSSLTLTSPKITTTTDIEKKCHHYEKKAIVDDWGTASKKPTNNSGYTTSGFTWLVIGMLVLGLVLGGVGFVVYSYYKSRSSDQGMTVRFMKSDI